MSNKKNQTKGAAMILVVLFFIIIATTLLIGISSPIANQIKSTSEFSKSKSSYNIADSQGENAAYRFNKGQNDAPTDISLLGATGTAQLTETSGQRSIEIKGSESVFDRYIKAIFAPNNPSLSLINTVQVGEGGVTMLGSSIISGDVYSNGDIIGAATPSTCNTSTYIGSSATVATLVPPTVSLSISSSTTPTAFPIGQTSTNQDIAQSFVAGTSTAINQITLYIKRTSSLATSPVIKIVNSVGTTTPGTTVIASSTLNYSTVTTSFAYVPFALSSSVPLVAGTTYWIVIDNVANNATKYYSLGTYSNLYASGSAKQGVFGGTMTDLTSGLDFSLSTSVGGDVGVISNICAAMSGSGEVWANTVNNVQAYGSTPTALKCKIGGTGNNKVCNTAFSDPVVASYPLTQSNIDDWQAQALAGSSTPGGIVLSGTSTMSLGPIMINGDLTLQGSSKLTITGPVYVKGNVLITGSSRILIDPSLGSSQVSGLISADGTITINTTSSFVENAVSSTFYTYLVLNSNKTCTTTADCNTNPSILINSIGGQAILTAMNGGIKMTAGSVNGAVAKSLYMSGFSIISSAGGMNLTNIRFSTGSTIGGWIKQSWKEILGGN